VTQGLSLLTGLRHELDTYLLVCAPESVHSAQCIPGGMIGGLYREVHVVAHM